MAPPVHLSSSLISSNGVHHTNHHEKMAKQGAGYIAFAWIFNGLLQLALLANRLYVRRSQRSERNRLSWIASDVLVTAAWVLNIAAISCDTITYSVGGMRADFLDVLGPEDSILCMKSFFAGLVIYWAPFYFIKISLLLFYLEVVPSCLRAIRMAIYVCFACVIGGLLFNEINLLTVCQPLSKQWDINLTIDEMEDTCMSSRSTAVAVGWHMFTDFYVYLIPFFLLRRIKIPAGSKKTTTIAIFASGFISVALSVPGFLGYILPVLWNPFMWLYYVSVVESTAAMFVACLPTLRITVSYLLSTRNRTSKYGVPWHTTINEMQIDFTAADIKRQLQENKSDDSDGTGLTTSVEGKGTMKTEAVSVSVTTTDRDRRGSEGTSTAGGEIEILDV